MPVADIMSRNPETVAPADDPRAAAAKMAARQVRRLPWWRRESWWGCSLWATWPRNRKLDMEAAAALSEISTNVKPRRGK